MSKITFSTPGNCLCAIRDGGRRLYIDAGDGWCLGPADRPDSLGVEEFRRRLLDCETEDELGEFIDEQSDRWYSDLEWV